MDRIELKGLVFLGNHGVKTEERERAQRLQVDVEIYCDLTRASQTDILSDTINYSLVRKLIKKVVEEESYYLLERIAGTIAEKILLTHSVEKVVVGVWKLDIWPDGKPGVVVTRVKK